MLMAEQGNIIEFIQKIMKKNKW